MNKLQLKKLSTNLSFSWVRKRRAAYKIEGSAEKLQKMSGLGRVSDHINLTWCDVLQG